MKNKKYVLTGESKIYFGSKLFRIKAVVSFANVKIGELGGWIEKEENLSQSGDAWVYGDARVYGNARVCDDAWVYGDARVYGNARVCDDGEIKTRTDLLQIGRIGSRNDTTTFFMTKEKVINVKCGCFKGSIDEFEKAVEKVHKGTIYEKQYKLAIELAIVSILRNESDD